MQGDLSREYVILMRGSVWTVMWLEVEPFGLPGQCVRPLLATVAPVVPMATSAKKRNELSGDRGTRWFDSAATGNKYHWPEMHNYT